MQRTIAFAIAALIAGLCCLAQAQTPPFGAVLLAPGCSPVPAYAASPLYQSLALTDTWGVESATLSTNKLQSPVCSNTAAKVAETTAASTGHDTNKQIAVTLLGATSYTLTSYYKMVVGTRNAQLQVNDATFANGAGGVYLASTCTVSSSFVFGTYTLNSATAARAQNGWCKFTLTFTSVASISPYIFLDLVNGTNNSYTGDGVSAGGFWGVDLR